VLQRSKQSYFQIPPKTIHTVVHKVIHIFIRFEKS